MAYLAVVKSENIRFKNEKLSTESAYFHVDNYEDLFDQIVLHYGLQTVAKLGKLHLYDRAFGSVNRICLNDTKQLPLNTYTNTNIIDIWIRIPFTSFDQSSSSPSMISL